MRRVLVGLLVAAAILIGGVVIARATSRSIAGVPCDVGEGSVFHIHSFLTIVDRGVAHHPPANVGIHPEHLCFYWIHTHDGTGILHIEAPHGFHPTLGQFFAIWGQPLSRTRIGAVSAASGERIRAYVNRALYLGDLHTIPLRNHESITLEIGPPFVPPVRGNFHGL